MTVVGGAYELLTLAGSGGMGAVWRARQLSLGRTVAVKLLLTETGDDEPRRVAARRLRDEARAAARVAHPDLVAVLDTGEDPVLGPFIVYELLDGGSLRDRLGRGALGWDCALEEVGRPLLDGLAALHDAGMVHRDVKPENIIAGSDGRFRLGDFGLALFEGRQARTADGSFVGTPGYLAPERIIGASVGAPSDVYAAAVVLAETATGHLPFRGTSVAEMVREQAVRSPSPSALAGLGLPAHVAAVLASALVREPDRRPGAAELLGRLVAPSTSTPTEVLRRQAPGRRRGATAPTTSRVVAPAAPPRRRRLLPPLLVLLACLAFVAAARRPWSPSSGPAPTPPSSLSSPVGHDDPELRAQAMAWVEQTEPMRKVLREERLRIYGKTSPDSSGLRSIEAFVHRGDALLTRIEDARMDGSWPVATRVVAAMQAALVARFDSHVDMSLPDFHRRLRPAGPATRATACTRAEALLVEVSAELARGSVEASPDAVAMWFEAAQRLLSASESLPEKEIAVAESKQALVRALGPLGPVMGLVELAMAATANDEARVSEAGRIPGLLRELGSVLMVRPGGSAAAAGFELALVRSLAPLLAAAVRDGLPPSALENVAASSLAFVGSLERRDGPSPELTAARLARAVLTLDLAVMAADKVFRDWRGGESVPAPGRREIMGARLVAAVEDLVPLVRRWIEASALPPPLADEPSRYLALVEERRRSAVKLSPAVSDPRVLDTCPADPAALGPWAVGCADTARERLNRIKALADDLVRVGRGESVTSETDRLVALVLLRRAFWSLLAVCASKEGAETRLLDLAGIAGESMVQDYLVREDGSLFGLGRRLVTVLATPPVEAAVAALRADPSPGAPRELLVVQAVVKLINRVAVGGCADLLESWHTVLAPSATPSSSMAVLRAVLHLDSHATVDAVPLVTRASGLVLAKVEESSPTSKAEADLFLECLGHLLGGWAALGVGGFDGRGPVIPEADGELDALLTRCDGILARWRGAEVPGDEAVTTLAAHIDVFRACLELRRSPHEPPRLADDTLGRVKEIRHDSRFAALEGPCRRLLAGEDLIRHRIVDPLTLDALKR